MENKYIIYSLLVLLIFIMGLSAVSAGDINTTDTAPLVENDNVDTIMSDTTDDDVIVGEHVQKDLTKKKIDDKKTAPDYEVVLDNSTFTARDDNINITGHVKIKDSDKLPQKVNLSVVIEDENIRYSEEVPPIFITTDDYGKFSLLYPGDQAGRHVVQPTIRDTDGSIIYWDHMDICILDKNGLIPTYVFFEIHSLSADTSQIFVALSDIYYNDLGNKKLIIRVEDKVYEAYTGKDGNPARINHTFKDYAKIDLSVYFAGDSKYAPCNVSTTRSLINYDYGTYSELTMDKINNIELVYDRDRSAMAPKDGSELKIKNGENITITGKLTDDTGNPIKNAKIEYSFFFDQYHDDTGIVTTNDKGDYTFTTKQRDNLNQIRVTYPGSAIYTTSSQHLSFDVVDTKKVTDIYIARPLITKLGDCVTIRANVTGYYDIPFTYTPLTIKINGKEYTNKTDGMGVLTYNYKTGTVGINNVTISYKGNSKFHPASSNTTFKVVGVGKTTTKITVNSIGNVQKDDYVTVTGRYIASTGINLTYTPIKIVINGVTYTNKTNGNGIYSYRFKASTLGTNNVTVSYVGNSRFIGDSASTTFNVLQSGKTATKITVNSLGTVQKDSYVTVTGRYTASTGINLTYTPIRITINGETYTNKTNGNGIYSYTYKASKLGVNNITVSYPGNARFIGATASTTFNVVNKTATKITVNTIGDVQKDSYVTVTGRYTASTGINLTYTPIKIVINGVTYTNKTNGNGIYSYTTKASTLGSNTVTVSYAGNARFIGASASTKFNVVNKTATKITINSIGEVQKDGYVTITGRYTASTGINLTYTPIKIVINGVTYTNKTNGNGIYSYTYKTSKLGVNNITVSYPGNARFIGATASTTFNVVNKTATKITVNSLGTVKKDAYVTVTGKYTASTGINLTYTPIRITINGVTYTNKTDAHGIYTYTFKASTVGVNNISVAYPGNARFIGATAKTTLTVKQ